MAVMVKHLPPEQRKSVILWFARCICIPFSCLILISVIANFWFIQALGAAYLIFMSIRNLWQFFHKEHEDQPEGDDHHFDESGVEKKSDLCNFGALF